MKKLLPLVLVLILSSCSKEVPSEKLVERGGLKYEVNSETPFTGTVVNYYPSGQVSNSRQYEDGLSVGKYVVYYPNGNIQRKGSFRKVPEDFYPLVKVIFDGINEEYYENGQLRYASMWENGYVSFDKEFHKNGYLKVERNYLDGLLEDGVVVSYNDSGDKHKEETYLDGDVVVTKYIIDGFLRRITEHQDNGIQKTETFYIDGTLSSRSSTKERDGNHFRHGLYEQYDRSGKLIESECYDDGSSHYVSEIVKNELC